MTETRSKRQYRSLNIRKAFRPAQARGNMAAAKLDWRTRTKGTFRQLGKKFPIGPGSSKSLPKIGSLRSQKYGRYGKTAPSKAYHMTRLELEALKAERDMEATGVKGFMTGIRLHDGTTTEIPLMAGSWHEAFKIAHKNMMRYNPDDIDEIVIVDPSLKEIAHAIAGGAHKAAGWLKKGITETIPKAYKRAEAEAVKAARRVGRVAALPAEIREAYKAGEETRPWGEAEAEAATKEQEAIQEAIRLKTIGLSPRLYEDEIEAMRATPGPASEFEKTRAAAETAIARMKPEYTASELAALRAQTERTMREREAGYRPRRVWEAPPTKSEIERRKRSASKPFQSRVFGSDGKPVSSASPEDSVLKKARRRLRKAKHALRLLGAMG